MLLLIDFVQFYNNPETGTGIARCLCLFACKKTFFDCINSTLLEQNNSYTGSFLCKREKFLERENNS